MATPTLLPDIIEETTQDNGRSGNGDFCIVLFNDDVTPFDAVVRVLCDALDISHDRAELYAYDVHCLGKAIVYYSPDVDDCEARAEKIATIGVRVEVQKEC